MSAASQSIGVFDSGVGGLTVLRALVTTLPHESWIYLGDTARLPYGTKSAATVQRYALRAAEVLVERGIKALVVACNTASAAALPVLRERFDPLPVIGVVEPGAAAAVAASRSQRIAVIATESTVAGGAYARAIAAIQPQAQVQSLACQLFVALAEEGWVDGEVAVAAAHRYLDALFAQGAARPDVLLLGCTHFPVLAPVLAQVAGPAVTVVDASAAVAAALQQALAQRGLLAEASLLSREPILLATDGVARFARVGATFLGRALAASQVQLVDL